MHLIDLTGLSAGPLPVAHLVSSFAQLRAHKCGLQLVLSTATQESSDALRSVPLPAGPEALHPASLASDLLCIQ